MYLNNGKEMTYKEEGAAFFPPLSMGQLIADADAATNVASSATLPLVVAPVPVTPASPESDSDMLAPWLTFAACAVGGFVLFGKKWRAR